MAEDLNFEESYISVGCNRNPFSVDWGIDDTLAYSAYNSIALVKFRKVCKVLNISSTQ